MDCACAYASWKPEAIVERKPYRYLRYRCLSCGGAGERLVLYRMGIRTEKGGGGLEFYSSPDRTTYYLEEDLGIAVPVWLIHQAEHLRKAI